MRIRPKLVGLWGLSKALFTIGLILLAVVAPFKEGAMMIFLGALGIVLIVEGIIVYYVKTGLEVPLIEPIPEAVGIPEIPEIIIEEERIALTRAPPEKVKIKREEWENPETEKLWEIALSKIPEDWLGYSLEHDVDKLKLKFKEVELVDTPDREDCDAMWEETGEEVEIEIELI